MMLKFHVSVKTERAVAVGSSAVLGHHFQTANMRPNKNALTDPTTPLPRHPNLRNHSSLKTPIRQHDKK
jgi:hypothetical protein